MHVTTASQVRVWQAVLLQVPFDSTRSFDVRAPGGFAYAQGRWLSEGLVLNAGLRVITSYSIHYTKLYDHAAPAPKKIEIILVKFTDQRADTNAVGTVRNGFGMKTASYNFV